MATPKLTWPALFKAINIMIANQPLPYVTRLSQRKAKATPNERAFAILIATILSLRTRDAVTEVASERLFKIANSPEEILALPHKQLADTIYPSAFFNQKAKQIHELCERLITENHGQVPHTITALTDLPGVGQKTANLVLTEGFGVPGICVDTHVHRILNRLGIVKTKTPDETELVLRKTLPKRYWIPINYSLVMFGMSVCKPVGPKCGACLLKKSCPTGLSAASSKMSRLKSGLAR